MVGLAPTLGVGCWAGVGACGGWRGCPPPLLWYTTLLCSAVLCAVCCRVLASFIVCLCRLCRAALRCVLCCLRVVRYAASVRHGGRGYPGRAAARSGRDGYNGVGGSGPDPPTPPPWSQKRSRYLVTKNVTPNRPFWAALCPYMCMGGGGGVMQHVIHSTFDTHSALSMDHHKCHPGLFSVIHCHHFQ